MLLNGTFDVLGPIMVGPSSSHTAGALRIARLAASLCPGTVEAVVFTLYNSFAKTYRGHGTDRALIAGILGLDTDDPRIRDAYSLAAERGLKVTVVEAPDAPELHPNTVDIEMRHSAGGLPTVVRGESVGGGSIRIARINGVEVDVTGRMPTLVVEHLDVPGMLALMTRELGDAGVNIAYMSSYRTAPGKAAYSVFECDSSPAPEVVGRICSARGVVSVNDVEVPGFMAVPPTACSDYDFSTASELESLCGRSGLSVGRAMRAREEDICGKELASSLIGRIVEVMRDETQAPIDRPVASLGGFIGGQAARLWTAAEDGRASCGDMLARACAYAMATIERSAAMGVIVAAPTAGSSGVVPGCLIACSESLGCDDARLGDALYAAAAIGALVEHWASVSGAEGGCQAEVGTASAMAAAGLVELRGGTARQALAAATIAVSNMLGLVCDPVRGLVEIPCQVRNAAGAANAFTACDLAMAGIELPIPFDEAVDALGRVGRSLPAALRETAQGGLATCPSVCPGCGG